MLHNLLCELFTALDYRLVWLGSLLCRETAYYTYTIPSMIFLDNVFIVSFLKLFKNIEIEIQCKATGLMIPCIYFPFQV